MDDFEEEISLDDAGSAVPLSCDDAENRPHSFEGPEAAVGFDATGSAVEGPAVSRRAASPAQESSANDEPPEELAAPARVRNVPLRRIRKSFGRAIRTLFRMKRRG